MFYAYPSNWLVRIDQPQKYRRGRWSWSDKVIARVPHWGSDLGFESCSLVAVCVWTTTLHSSPQVVFARPAGTWVWYASPLVRSLNRKSLILVKGNKINAIIRGHLRNSWHPSVEYVTVNLLAFTRNSSYLWEPRDRHRPIVPILSRLPSDCSWNALTEVFSFLSQHLSQFVTDPSFAHSFVHPWFPPPPAVSCLYFPLPYRGRHLIKTLLCWTERIPLLLTHQWSRGLLYIQN